MTPNPYNPAKNDNNTPLLTVIIPCYNESRTLPRLLEKVISVNLSKEIIFVDDGSTDNSMEIANSFKQKAELITIGNENNSGKGAAVRKGIEKARGNYIIIQDADLEYDPEDYKPIIREFEGGADVVYGSRILKKGNPRGGFFFWLGGITISAITSILYGARITDEPTCYKAFRREVIKDIPFKGTSFDWEPEVTAKILKAGYKIREVPISYNPRSVKEGKKINWKDGIKAVWTLIKYRFVS
ncbi:MAG: glycosyltransferase [candidate division Zixibacteria bacterium]|nr:glycosyltransferase [candidate division Zixibacteria bacterium]